MFKDVFSKTWIEIKRRKRVDNQKRLQKEREQTEKAIQEQRAQEKNARQVKKIGKPLMRQIDKPKVKKVEIKKKSLTGE